MKASRLWIGFVALVLAGCSPTTNLLIAPHAQPVEIHPSNRRRILRLERVDQIHHAGADDGLQLFVGSRSLPTGLSRDLSQRPIPDLLAAVMVGDGISEHAVEPGHRRIGPADGVDPVESADECLLQNVFRHIA